MYQLSGAMYIASGGLQVAVLDRAAGRGRSRGVRQLRTTRAIL